MYAITMCSKPAEAGDKLPVKGFKYRTRKRVPESRCQILETHPSPNKVGSRGRLTQHKSAIWSMSLVFMWRLRPAGIAVGRTLQVTTAVL